MEKIFKIGSRRYCTTHQLYPSYTTATVVWKVVNLGGEDFFAGAVYTNGVYLCASMCAQMDSEIEFCQALLRKAYAIPKPRTQKVRFFEGVNICGRVFHKCFNPTQWEHWKYNTEGPIWVYVQKGSKLMNKRR